MVLAAAVAAAQDGIRVVEVSETRPLRKMPENIHRVALPRTGLGLAAEYPGDTNIRRDSRVVFAADFESKDPFRLWTERKDAEAVSITSEGAHAGTHALSIAADLSRNTGGYLFKRLPAGEDVLFVRFYVKFPNPVEYVHHFVHLTADDPPRKFPLGGAGVCPDGGRRFSTAIEPFGFGGRFPAPGAWQMLAYWCEMGIASDGKYWGNQFEPDPPLPVTADAWTCVELMLKANSTPTSTDGMQAFWINGEQGAAFDGFRWRTASDLKLNGVWFLYHLTEAGARQHGSLTPKTQTSVLFDDVVVAREYIGPRTEPAPTPEPPPAKPEGDTPAEKPGDGR